MESFRCGRHRAFVYERGGVNLIAELTPLTYVNWRRTRDDVSSSQATIGTGECCSTLGLLETCSMELHVTRDDEKVWEGPIVRLEYQQEHVDVFASDILWVASRTALDEGYSHAYPNIGMALERMDWLMRQKTFAKYGDPWKVLPHLHKILGPDDPKTAKSVQPWSMTTWEDFDNYAEDGGTDYTVVNRDIYYFDLQLAWATLSPLDQSMISEFPRVVEYGNEFASRYFQTNTQGYAGMAEAPGAIIDHYGYLDALSSSWTNATTEGAPTAEELAQMAQTARKELQSHYPPPVSVAIPSGSTLMPNCPWNIADMVPGAWFDITVEGLCREVSSTHRLHEVNVTESAPAGETFTITTIDAPAVRIEPPI